MSCLTRNTGESTDTKITAMLSAVLPFQLFLCSHVREIQIQNVLTVLISPHFSSAITDLQAVLVQSFFHRKI